MQKLLNIILNILVTIAILIVVAVGYTFFQIGIFKKSYVNFCGYTALIVQTGSMQNTININDLIIVKVGKENLEVNDIISYQESNYIITHRIIQIDGDKIITKGDNNNTEDDPISKNAVIGKVIKVIPSVGIWQRVLQTKEVLISIVVTIILFIISFSIKTEEEQKDEKK